VTVETAKAEDVLAFIRGYWIPKHLNSCRTTAGASKTKVMAVATVKQTIQFLSTSYGMLGREGQQNPAKHKAVRAFKEGYRKMLHELGVKEKKAVVFKEKKMDELVQFLAAEIGRMEQSVTRCCALTDLAAILYLWEAWVWGKECGHLEKRQVHEESGIVLPGWSKTVQQEPSSQIEVSCKKGNWTFLAASAAVIKEAEALGQPVGDGFLFRPLSRDRRSFRQEAITAGALRARVQKALKRAGLFKGQTLHSFRRSAAHHAVDVHGFTVEKAMQKGRWKNYSAFRGYMDEVAECLKWDKQR
jgi:hypothetical protein